MSRVNDFDNSQNDENGHVMGTLDVLIHLPAVNDSAWTFYRGFYERRVSFNCEHGNRHYALLKVYIDDEGAAMIFVRFDGVVRRLSVGEYVDPLSTADETLLVLSRDCGCRND